MNKISETFGRPRVVLPVVHCIHAQQVDESAFIAREAGADGVWLINQGGMRPRTMVEEAHNLLRLYPGWFVGVNLLGFSPHETSLLLAGNSLPGLWDDGVSPALNGVCPLYFGDDECMSQPCEAPTPPPLQRDFYHEDFRAFLGRFAGRVDGIADLIVTSPPYVDARDPGAYGVEKPWTAQDDRDLGDAMFAALRPGGTAFVVVGSPVRKWRKGHGTERGLEPMRWLLDLVDRVGFTCRDVLAYHRTGNVGEYRGRFRGDFEPILWLERPGGEPAFDKNPLDEIAVEGVAGGRRAGAVRRADGTQNGRTRSGDALERGVKRRGTVWYYAAGGGTVPTAMQSVGHPASFPLKIAEDTVACFSRAGDLVLDPFSGRGTTALACARLGRRFAGGDLGRAKDGRPWAEVAREVVGALTA